jgi:hypothetical protein
MIVFPRSDLYFVVPFRSLCFSFVIKISEDDFQYSRSSEIVHIK